MRTAVSTALSLALLSQSAWAAEARPLSPASPWNVDYADDSCALRRDFVDGGNTVSLEMRQFAPGDGFRVIVAGKGLDFKMRAAQVRFAPAPKSTEVQSPAHLTYGAGTRGVSWNDSLFVVRSLDRLFEAGQLPRQRQAADYRKVEGGVQGLEIGGVLEPGIFLKTGELYRPMQAMRQCLDELLGHWGIDVAAQKTLSRHAKPLEPRKWRRLLQTNFPKTERDIDGLVRARIMVGADGRATSCHIQIKSQDPLFETTTCREMMKATLFEPALDAAGKPIASYYLTQVYFSAD